MALPTNTVSTAGTRRLGGTGVRNKITVNAPVPQNTGWKIYDLRGNADGSIPVTGGIGNDNNTGPGGGSGSYTFGIFGKPKMSGIEQALGAIGTGLAILNAGSALLEAGKGVMASIDSAINQAKAMGQAIISKAKVQQEKKIKETITDVIAPVDAKPLKGDWRVRIGVKSLGRLFPSATADQGYLKPLTESGKNSVVFPYTPQITVIHKGYYVTQSLTHSIHDFQNYKNSSVDDIVINGNFTVQTHEEGQYWLAATKFFKILTKSFYGQSYPQGFPPVVAQLYGYGDHMFGNDGQNIVVKSVSIDLPRNVQYKRIILNGKKEYVPMDSNIIVTVSPVVSRTQLRQFNMADYANGTNQGIL